MRSDASAVSCVTGPTADADGPERLRVRRSSSTPPNRVARVRMNAPIHGFIESSSCSMTSRVTTTSDASAVTTTLAVRGDAAKIAVSPNMSPGPS